MIHIYLLYIDINQLINRYLEIGYVNRLMLQ